MPKTNYIQENYTSSAVTTNSTAITSATYVLTSNSPALTLTPRTDGVFKVYVSLFGYVTATGSYPVAKVVNTSGGATLLSFNEGTNYIGSAASDHGSQMYLQATFQLAAGVTYVFDVHMKSDGGANVQWIAVDRKSYMYAERMS